jgi:hypothetical protein
MRAALKLAKLLGQVERKELSPQQLAEEINQLYYVTYSEAYQDGQNDIWEDREDDSISS